MRANHSPATVTVEEVRHIADLSNLRLTPEEEVAMERDLNAILTYVAELNELDTGEIAPMAQVSEMLASTQHPTARSTQAQPEDSRATLRPDDPRSSLERAAVMINAPDSDGVFFKVPKVIER